MDGKGTFKLDKDEIIRGYKSYEVILNDSKLFKTHLLTGFLKANKVSLIGKISPLQNVKVGFIISKRKFRKANKRNKIRRLLKESYRLSRHQYFDNIDNYNIQLLISFNSTPEIMAVKDAIILNYTKLSNEMGNLLNQVREYLIIKKVNG